MTKSASEIKFEKARKKLSDSLKNLEEVVKEKLQQVANEPKAGDSNSLQDQSSLIQSLNSEINNLQNSLSHLGKETEFLNEKNKILSEKFSKFRSDQSILIEAIEADLAGIEEIIKDEEQL